MILFSPPLALVLCGVGFYRYDSRGFAVAGFLISLVTGAFLLFGSSGPCA
ncbi:MAG: hypothetical protein ACYTG7_00670 [Planctomycetota bacterium]|jgi:hypothetical protein